MVVMKGGAIYGPLLTSENTGGPGWRRVDEKGQWIYSHRVCRVQRRCCETRASMDLVARGMSLLKIHERKMQA